MVCEIYLKVIKKKKLIIVISVEFKRVSPKVCLIKESKMKKNMHTISVL